MQRTICVDNRITPKTVIEIHNALRLLGLRGSSKGTTLINKAIQIIIKNNYEYVVIKDVYREISKEINNANIEQIRVAIKYALDNRNESKSIKNFEKFFGYEYDEEMFTNKNFIEELSRVITNNVS